MIILTVFFFRAKDLVNEKLKTQQMNNDLEKLAHELEKIGLNKERLLHDEQSSDDRWEHQGLPGTGWKRGGFGS